MEKLYSNIIGTPIFEDDAARPFASIKDILLDPEKIGKLLALIIDINKNLIISPIDILFWDNAIKINNSSIITHANDVLRVEEVQKSGIFFYGNKVETEDGDYLGKVFDFSIDIKTLDLKKIFVAKSILGLFRYDNKIISSNRIIEVLKDKIIVKNGLATVKEADQNIAVENIKSPA